MLGSVHFIVVLSVTVLVPGHLKSAAAPVQLTGSPSPACLPRHRSPGEEVTAVIRSPPIGQGAWGDGPALLPQSQQGGREGAR